MDTSIDYNDTSGYNPLFLAVHNGDINLLPSLLEKYSATETILGRTLITVAAARGHEEIVRLLAKNDKEGNSPLHFAVKHNQTSVFNQLVKMFNVNQKNCLGETPLHYAAMSGSVEFTKILIENGANVNARDRGSRTPIYYAFKKQNVELAEILYKNGVVLTDQDYLRWYPLCTAAEMGNLEMVKLIMTNGWNSIDTFTYYRSPLHAAVSWGKLKVVDYLMKNGSKKNNTVTEDGSGLLKICIRQGRINTLKYLIDAGLKTNKNLLAMSINCGQYEVWKYLLTCHSRIITDTFFSETKLHWAVRTGQLQTVKVIVNQQANTVENDSLACKLAVYIAAENGNEDILRVLLSAGYSTESCFDDTSPLHIATTNDNLRLVELLLKAGADVNSTTKSGYTPLHFAAAAGQSAMVKFLLQSGADPSKSNKNDESPLLFAVKMISRNKLITLSTFMNLVEITEMLILPGKKEKIAVLLQCASRIEVWNDENEQNDTLILKSKELTSFVFNDDGFDVDDNDDSSSVGDDSDNDFEIHVDMDDTIFRKNKKSREFRPELVRCIFNHLKDDEIKYHLQLMFEEGHHLHRSPEFVHALMEYDDSKSCYNIGLDTLHFEGNNHCCLLLIDYSRNVDDLLNVYFRFSSNSSVNIRRKNSVLLLKLTIARLALLTNSGDSKVLEFCKVDGILDWCKECEMEKISLKETQIDDNFNVTFYDILTEPVAKIANYVRNEDFRKAVESSREKFKIYSVFLKFRIEKGIRRWNLQEECMNLMHNLIKRNPKIQFSNDDLDQIFQYFSVVDLRRFSAAFL